MIKNLTQSIAHSLKQIEELLNSLADEEFIQPIPLLSGATLGQHSRHIIEFYLELFSGYDSGEVNYDARKRDHRIETDRQFAISQLANIVSHLNRSDKQLRITADYGEQCDLGVSIHTNYYRELMYNLEHTVHHMAILRIGVTALSSLPLENDFGVAVATLKYREACAQ